VIFAELVGTGMAADAYHLTGTAPDGKGAILGMEKALKEAGLQPQDVNYINAHATSTPLGDASEIKAMEKVFGQNDNLYISSTKSMTGHLLGGTGAVEALACVLSVMHNMVPPTINTKNLDDLFPKHRKVV
jgi:3-oxoacyl-[acyl-carrier-protein] synthase II